MNDFFYQRLLAAVVVLAGISACGTTGDGMSVGVPVGSNGHLRIGGHTWL